MTVDYTTPSPLPFVQGETSFWSTLTPVQAIEFPSYAVIQNVSGVGLTTLTSAPSIEFPEYGKIEPFAPPKINNRVTGFIYPRRNA
jgi:hypothetical protein